ncbi:hypothetical protein [Nocardioides marmotae]|uniref:hypothetical protein n=1 Tax=Nocardioides marmotae TaxID=2663857 RepID=UPI0012B63740|nr:hypothetical protein [Nocardioides marmotae]MBC9733678.1 hypothetical protein [Nocardioides marmotae]MTB84781.1 hypothetical protein [Nocardioides marmotae]
MRSLLVSSALVATLLTGCAEAEDAVRGAAREAGCAAARQAMDEAERRVRDAVADLRADPEAARRELRAVRGVLDAAERGLGGEARQQVDRAGKAVDRLLAEARDAAAGTRVDDVAVDEAERQLDGAVGEITNLC